MAEMDLNMSTIIIIKLNWGHSGVQIQEDHMAQSVNETRANRNGLNVINGSLDIPFIFQPCTVSWCDQ